MDLNINNNKPKTEVPAATSPATNNDELNKPYTDHRNVVISLVHNYSNYRKANMKVLGQRGETIGSSISSCKILSSNKGEVEAYFPALIGLSANNPEFITRVKAWLSNIQLIINDNDKSLDISFVYNRYADYLAFKAKEDKIDEAYAKVDRNDISAIKDAIKTKVTALNALESEKYAYGYPVNLEEYIIYRHCLLYRDVAKDIALINSDPTLRFYIKDAAKEAEKQKKLVQEKKKAMANFIELGASEQKFSAMFVTIVALKNENISLALLKSKDEKESYVMDFVNTNPDKFNKLFNDKTIETRALIETLIVRGELVRAEYNQQISTADGAYIGSNMKEAIAYFNNPNNKEAREAYETKVKMF